MRRLVNQNSDFWKQRWEFRSRGDIDDYALDRGTTAPEAGLEALATRELLEFIAARQGERILDAGCGTGATARRLVDSIGATVYAFDYAEGMVERAKHRLAESRSASLLFIGSVNRIALADGAFDRVICLSVLQYLDDAQARQALSELVRITRADGELVLHVKNLSSLYLSTLLLGKKLKSLCGMTTKIEFYRGYGWYVNELERLGCHVTDYNSFNILTIDGAPGWLVSLTRSIELKQHRRWPLRSKWLRRLGAELKIKARVAKAHA